MRRRRTRAHLLCGPGVRRLDHRLGQQQLVKLERGSQRERRKDGHEGEVGHAEPDQRLEVDHVDDLRAARQAAEWRRGGQRGSSPRSCLLVSSTVAVGTSRERKSGRGCSPSLEVRRRQRARNLRAVRPSAMQRADRWDLRAQPQSHLLRSREGLAPPRLAGEPGQDARVNDEMDRHLDDLRANKQAAVKAAWTGRQTDAHTSRARA